MTALRECPLSMRLGPTTTLEGALCVPPRARGLVVFVHGSGSSRHSARNRAVAGVLQAGGLATLLFDLLTPDEEAVDTVTRHLRFDIELLSTRVVAVVDQLCRRSETTGLALGLFGASTGAAAALVAAAARPRQVEAVVCRGGRPDLAMSSLGQVAAPVLLLVGDRDDVVVALNESALAHLRGEAQLMLIQGATHLFEESGTLDLVATHACRWFRQHLGTGHPEVLPLELR
ncbi:MAG: dienelactone hydrolase family protein [Myxococcota bacterium]